MKRKKNKRYINYDYDDVFDKSLETANEEYIKQLLNKRIIHSIYATKTIYSGNQLEIEIYPEFTRTQAKKYHIPKKKNQAMKNLNHKNARKKLERLINSNFNEKDLWLTLTYDKSHIPKTIEDARKDIVNYIRRLNYRKRKRKLKKAKYIYVTEFSKEKGIRCHHHILIDNDLSMDELESVWKCGRRNNVRKLAPDKDGLLGLADYISKDPKGKKRWGCSLDLKKPKVTKSYHKFKGSHVKKMVHDRNKVRLYAEKFYKNMEYTKEEIFFNEVNGRFYIYIRMRKRE